MRYTLSTIAFVALAASAGAAAASSIDEVHGKPLRQPSIVTVSCHFCPPPVERRKSDYQVPTVNQSGELAEVIEEDGARKLKRIDNLMGGSPVLFISSAEGWETRGSSIIASATGAPNQIDTNATAAVVDGSKGSDAASQATVQGLSD